MLKSVLSLAAILFTASAQAETPFPICGPIAKGKAAILSCEDADFTYSIRIESWASTEDCGMRVDYHDASVSVFERNGRLVRTLKAQNGEFNYSLGDDGRLAFFNSYKIQLNLKQCRLAPPHTGGDDAAVSFGN